MTPKPITGGGVREIEWRLMARFDGSIRSIVADLGKQSGISSDKARETLGWTTRPAEASIEDTARSLH